MNLPILRSFAWVSVTKIVVQSIVWLTTLVVARILDPSDYGVMAIAGIFLTLLTLVVEIGMSQGLIQKADTSRQEEDSVFYLSLAVSICAYALLYVSAPHIASFYGLDTLTQILRVAGVALILGSIQAVPVAIAMRRMDFRYKSRVELASNLTSAAVVVTLATGGFGVWSLVWGFVALNLVGALAYLPILRRIPRPSFSIDHAHDVIQYGLKITANQLLYLVYSRADIFVIGKFLGERAAGHYSMAFHLITLPLDKIGSLFNQIAFPAMARLQADPVRSQDTFLDMQRYLLLVCLPLLFGIAVVAEDLVVLVLTDKWRPIVPIIQALSVVSALRLSGTLISAVMNGRGRAGTMLRITVLYAIFLPLGFVIGVQFGIKGVVLAWLIVYPVIYIYFLHTCLAELTISFRRYWSCIKPAYTASMMMIIGVRLFHLNLSEATPIYRLASEIALGAAIYCGYFLLFDRKEMFRAWVRVAIFLRNRSA